VSGVSATIGRTSGLGPALGYLRSAISAATHDVYLALVISTVVTIAVIAIIPRRMAVPAPADPADERVGRRGR
jgi:hypothetical protein